MRSFISLLGPSHASMLAVTAAMLDRDGVDPDALRSGVSLIVCPRSLDDAIQDAVNRLVFNSEAAQSPREDDPVRAYVLSAGNWDDFTLRRAIARDLPVILVGRRFDLDSETLALVDRTCAADVAITDDIVRRVILAVTGADLAVSGVGEMIDAELLASVVRRSVPGAEALAKLVGIAAGRKRKAQEAQAKADREANEAAIDLITVAADTVSDAPPPPRLSTVSGFGAARDWGLQLASDIQDYRAGKLSWDDVDRGILLTGEPGVGKTFFVRLLAEECGIPLISSSYSDWEAGQSGSAYVVKAMRKIFDDARKKSPCLVFIDEIDSMGIRGGSGHNTGYWDAIINALLQELDGARGREGVIAIAATNNPNRVDPAIKRAGRLERQVEIPLPDQAEIRGIIAHHLAPAPLDDDALDKASCALRGMSPATIALLCREARRAARRRGDGVTPGDVIDASLAHRPQREADADRAVCIHEAAHAVAAVVQGLQVSSVHVGEGPRCAVQFETVRATKEYLDAHLVCALAARRADAMLGWGVRRRTCSRLCASATE